MRLRLQEIRERKGLSQRDLAKLLNTSNASISRLESGDPPSLLKLERAAQVLGVSLVDLLSERPIDLSELEALITRIPDADRHMVLDLARSLAEKASES